MASEGLQSEFPYSSATVFPCFIYQCCKEFTCDIIRSKSAVSDALGLFNSLITRPDIYSKRPGYIIICIFIQKGEKIQLRVTAQRPRCTEF